MEETEGKIQTPKLLIIRSSQWLRNVARLSLQVKVVIVYTWEMPVMLYFKDFTALLVERRRIPLNQ